MAITWGSYDGHLRFGFDVSYTTPGASSTAVTVTVKLYIQCSDSWNFDDDQSWKIVGALSASGSFHNSLADGDTKLLYSTSFSTAIDYDGGPTLSYSAMLSGAYNGASPTWSRTITLPARPPSAPSAPTTPNVGSITATSAYVTWGATSTNGADLTGNGGQVSTTSSFASLVTSWSVTGWQGRAVTGLPKGTTLYVRVRALNSEGWSPWSASRSFTTLSSAAASPAITGISAIGPQSATVAMNAPSDTGGEAITGFEVERATDSGFTANVAYVTKASSPITIGSLAPGTTYYVRARAYTSFGPGAWSATTSFKTLSAVRIGNGTSWVPALVWVGDGTKWVPATVKVGDGTTWK